MSAMKRNAQRPVLAEAVWKRGHRSAYGLLGFLFSYLGADAGCDAEERERRRHTASSLIAFIVFAMPSSLITRLKL
jgi:hypothetical protein